MNSYLSEVSGLLELLAKLRLRSRYSCMLHTCLYMYIHVECA